MGAATMGKGNGAVMVNGGEERERLLVAREAHQRGEVVGELAEQANTLRRALAKLYTAQDASMADPVWRDDLAFELSTVLQALNDAVRQLDGATITLDAA